MKQVRFYVALMLVPILVLTQSASVHSISAGGIGGRPANPDPKNPRTSSIFIHTIKEDETKNDQILIKNSSDQREVIDVYAVDGVVTQSGDLTCRQKVEPLKDAGKWIKLAKGTLTLSPNTDELIDFTITAPRNADVGEHNGCIVIQRRDTDAEKKPAGGIQLQTRQAVRVAIIVPGDIKRKVSIDQFDIVREGALQKYTVGIRNVGNVSADVNIKLVVKNSRREVVYENGGEYAAVANETRTFTYESNLKPFFGGKYTVDLEIGYDKRPGTWGTQDISQLITEKAPQKELFFWPSSTAWIGLVVVILAVALYFTARRRSKLKAHSFGTGKRR